MNSLYTSGVRQTNSIQADLERLRNGDASSALLGAFIPHLQTPTTTSIAVRADLSVPLSYAKNNRGLRLDGKA